MINDLKQDGEQRMQKSLDSLELGFAKVRTGRAHPSILNGVMVSYYGSDVPLNQVANVGLEDSRTLLVQPFERSMVAAIDKAIREAGLGLNPITADAIRVPMAALTEETRRDMQKVARNEAENAKEGDTEDEKQPAPSSPDSTSLVFELASASPSLLSS